MMRDVNPIDELPVDEEILDDEEIAEVEGDLADLVPFEVPEADWLETRLDVAADPGGDEERPHGG